MINETCIGRPKKAHLMQSGPMDAMDDGSDDHRNGLASALPGLASFEVALMTVTAMAADEHSF